MDDIRFSKYARQATARLASGIGILLGAVFCFIQIVRTAEDNSWAPWGWMLLMMVAYAIAAFKLIAACRLLACAIREDAELGVFAEDKDNTSKTEPTVV